MAFTLSAATAVICITLSGILGVWVLGNDTELRDDRQIHYKSARICAFIIAILLLVLTWVVFTHQVFPQWLTGVRSQPSIDDAALQNKDSGFGIILIVLTPVIIFTVTTMIVRGVMYALAYIDEWCTNHKDDEEDSKDIASESISAAKLAIFMFILLCMYALSKPYKPATSNDVFGGTLGFDYNQTITSNYVTDEKVLYENNKGISLEVHRWRTKTGETWVDVSTITTLSQLPSEYDIRYRVSKGYDTLKIGDIWFTENHNMSGEIPEGLEDKAVIKITKVTLVSENVSFHDGTNTDVVRSTQDLKRIHIEYEVTNIDELRASIQNKEDLKQFIDGK